MKIIHALLSTAAAATLLVGGALAGSASVENSTTAPQTAADGEGKNLDAERPAADATLENVTTSGGVTRIHGSDRYGTAAAIARAYDWEASNTVTVYIASGQELPDALALGPSTYGDGPLLLVRPDGIPGATSTLLKELKPCYIDVVGGPGVVSDQVLNNLKQFANPALCS